VVFLGFVRRPFQRRHLPCCRHSFRNIFCSLPRLEKNIYETAKRVWEDILSFEIVNFRKSRAI
jgi:hypothetical protein